MSALLSKISSFFSSLLSVFVQHEKSNTASASTNTTTQAPIVELTAPEAVQLFVTSLKNNSASESTVRNYSSDISQFLQQFPSHSLNELLSVATIQQFAISQYQKNLKLTSIQRKIASIKQFSKWLFSQHCLGTDPFATNLRIDTLDGLTSFLRAHGDTQLIEPTPPPPTIKPDLAPAPSSFFWFRGNKKSSSRGWYARYHSLSFTPYLHLAILIVFSVIIGVFAYRQFFSEAPINFAYPNDPVVPTRILSFQGRLTQANGNPITTATDVTFRIWDQTSGGTAGTCTGAGGEDCYYTTGVCSIDPDQDGIFSTVLGEACGSAIPATVFSENADLWLEITVESETLSPRQRIASVPYALNSETLQGFPINATKSATVNTVAVMNEWGEIVLGEVSPKIKSVSGNFQIEGESITLQTTAGSDGDITLNPDGTGIVNLLSDVVIDGYLHAPGATLSATYAGATPLIVNGTGGQIFSIANNGNISGVGTLTGLTGLTSSGTITFSGLTADRFVKTTTGGELITSEFIDLTSEVSGILPLANGGTNANLSAVAGGIVYSDADSLEITSAGTNGQCLISGGSSAPTWGSCGAGGLSGLWNITAGAIHPVNSTVDFFVGGTATSSAKFAVLNVNSGTPTATIAGSTTGNALSLTGDGTIATSNNRTLSLNPNGGNVGIGTSTPAGNLEVASSGETNFRITAGGAGAANFYYYQGTTQIGRIFGGSTFNIDAAGGGTLYLQRLNNGNTVISNGNLGIGTTTPTAGLHINRGFGANDALTINQLNSGNIFTASASGTTRLTLTNGGNLGIGDTTPAAALTVGSGDLFQVNSSGAIAAATGITSSGTITFSGLSDGLVRSTSGVLSGAGTVNLASEVSGILPLANGGTNANLTAVAGGIVYSDADSLEITAAGTNGQCLVSAGTGTPTWGSCGSGSNWNIASGTLQPINTTLDLLVGGTASSSAKFAVLNVNSGTPIASVSSGTSGAGVFLTADGSLSTTGRQSLILGNSSSYDTTGNTLINPNGTGSVVIGGSANAGEALKVFGDIGVSTDGSSIPGNTPAILGFVDMTSNEGGRFQFGDEANAIQNGFGQAMDIYAFHTIRLLGNQNITSAPAFSTKSNAAVEIVGGEATDTVLEIGSSSGQSGLLTNWKDFSGNTLIAVTAGGNLGIGDTTPAAALTVGSGDLFQVNSSGAIAAATGITSSGTITFSGLSDGLVRSTSGVLSGAGTVNLASEVSGILPLANGGTNKNLTAVAGGIVYTDGDSMEVTTAGTNGQCLVSAGSGTPTWGSCGGGGSNWNIASGTIQPINSTVDFLVGGTASSSAKFAVLNVNSGVPSASISAGTTGGGAYLTANGNLQTTLNQTLTIGGATTGNLAFSPRNGSGTSTFTGGLTQSGGIVNMNVSSNNAVNIGTGTSTGTITLGGTGTQTISLGNGAGAKTVNLGSSNTTSSTTILSGSGSLTLNASNGSNSTFIASGTTTGSVFIGGSANQTIQIGVGAANKTVSLGSNNSTSTTTLLSGSGGLNLNINNNQPTNIGTGTSTGLISLGGGSGTLAINTTNWDVSSAGVASGLTGLSSSGTITFSGLSDGLIRSTSGVLSGAGTVSLTTEVSGILPIANGGTNTSSIGTAGSIAYSTGSAYAFSAAGTTGECLVSAGTGTPTWGACGGGSNWNIASGTIQPINSTVDFLVGGTASSSAKFAVLNVNSGVPSASISAGTSGGGSYLTADGNLQTTNNQTLTLGGSTTGNIVLAEQVDLGSATTGLRVSTAGQLSDIDGNAVVIADDLQINGGDILGSTGETRISLDDSTDTTLVSGELSVTGDLTLTGNDLLFGNGETINNSTNGTIAFTNGSTTLASIRDLTSYGVLNITPKSSASDPGTCTVGDIYVNSNDATIKACTATNTWEALDGAGAWNDILDPTANTSIDLSTYTTTFDFDGTTTTGWTYNADSLTTGTGQMMSFDALTSGNGLFIESAGSARTMSGDLFKINLGANVTATGNLLVVQDDGSDLFAVKSTKITSALPHEFTAAGDVSIAYDLVLTNQTASYIKSNGPLTLEAGEVFENNDLTITTYGTGALAVNAAGGSEFTRSGATVATFNRTTDDGAIISLQQAGTEEGTISVSGSTISYNAFTGSHYAWSNQIFEKGLLMSLTGNNKRLHNKADSEILYGITPSSVENDSQILGAYLAIQEPSKPLNSPANDNPHLIMAVGNGEMWVVDQGENLKVGEYLVSSNVQGHARKDSNTFEKSYVIARVAEPVNWATVPVSTVNGQQVKRKLVSVFFESFVIDRSMQLALANDGTLTSAYTVQATPTQSNTFQIIANSTGKLVDRLGVFSSAMIGNLQAGFIQSKTVLAETITATQKLITPEVETAKLATSLISPVNNQDLTVMIGNNGAINPDQQGKFKIKNSNQQTVLEVNSAGDTTISGQLNVNKEVRANSVRAQQMQANLAQLDALNVGNATLSGQLFLNNGKTIEQVLAENNEYIASLSADITQQAISGIPQSTTPSSFEDFLTQLTGANDASISATIASLNNENLNLDSDSMILSSDAVFIHEYLGVNGYAQMNTVNVQNSLSVGQSMLFVEDTISTMNDTLFIQPTGAGKIDLMASLLVLDDTGTVTINGDLYVAGNVTVEDSLLANTLEPADYSDDFVLKLATESAQVLGETTRSQFSILDASNSAVASIDASGSARFNSLTTQGVVIQKPVSTATDEVAQVIEAELNSTAGSKTLAAGQTELVILNNNVKSSSLIYLTPTSNTQNQVLFIKEKELCINGTQNCQTSFTIGINQAVAQPITFNYWIVQQE